MTSDAGEEPAAPARPPAAPTKAAPTKAAPTKAETSSTETSSTETSSAETAPAGAGASTKLDKGVLIIAGVVVLGMIMSILDVTVVSVALETFQKQFDASTAQVAWTMTGYTLALATVIPLTGWAADRFGTKRLYMLALVLFAGGSLLCSTAGSLQILVTFRVLQGLGGGMLMPLGMTIMTRAAGPDRIGRLMAVLGIPMLLGPIFGPILGGWLIDIASWHWIFLINLPIGAVALTYAWFALPKDSVSPSETFDYIGMLLLSPGLALLLYGISSIPAAKQDHGTIWTAQVVVTASIGIVLVAAFVPWSLRRRNIHPLVELRLLGDRYMTVAVVTMALFAMAFFGASLLFALQFQRVFGYSPMKSGWALAPQGFGAMVTMPIAGALADKIGPGKVVLTGLVLDVTGVALLGTTAADSPYWRFMVPFVIMGFGMGSTMMPVFTAALSRLTDHNIARGSTLMNITQQVAASIGTALFSVLLTSFFNRSDAIVSVTKLSAATGGSQDPSALARAAGALGLDPTALPGLFTTSLHDMGAAFAHVYLIAASLVACCIIPALFLPRRKADKPVDPAAMMGH
ncbi:MAG: DHA2 family efflux MFS transporter permease subunit [Frankiaceae bacterium]|nr:DHA2 family efflux MFS transporter permease subunit [Frankiaceae bacterium]